MAEGNEMNLTNLDQAQSLFFRRQLEAVKTKTYERQYPELMARKLIPVSTELPPWATSFIYREYDKVGLAKLISDYATDLPKADAYVREFPMPIKGFGISFGYDISEIGAAQMAGVPLEQRRSDAAREGYERALDQTALFGDQSAGFRGFLNHPNVPVGSVTGAWATKTPKEIVKDISDAVAAIRSLTKGVESGPFTVLLPDAQYTLIAQTQNSDASDATILEFVLKSNPWVAEIAPLYHLAGAGAGGADRMMLYTRNPDKLTLEIPLDFQILEPQPKGLAFEVPCHARYGGVVWYYPLSARFVDGI